MNRITKKHIIKIPHNLNIHYCNIKQIILISNKSSQKVLPVKTKLIINNKKKIIKVTRIPFLKISTSQKKKLKSLQSTQVTILKQLFLDILGNSCKKLNLIGVGFRLSPFEISRSSFLHFKLGYSHSIFFRIPKNLKFVCIKANKFYIIGNSYLLVTQIAALIKSLKFPEPYKGKGILYTTEKILLKEGKKI